MSSTSLTTDRSIRFKTNLPLQILRPITSTFDPSRISFTNLQHLTSDLSSSLIILQSILMVPSLSTDRQPRNPSSLHPILKPSPSRTIPALRVTQSSLHRSPTNCGTSTKPKFQNSSSRYCAKPIQPPPSYLHPLPPHPRSPMNQLTLRCPLLFSTPIQSHPLLTLTLLP